MNPPSMVDGNTAHSHLAPPALVEDADEDKALKKDQGGAENTSTGVLDALNSSPIIHDNARPKNSPLSTDEYTDIGKSSSNGQDDDYHQSGDSSGNQEDASDSLLEKRGRTPVWTSSSDTDETLSKPSASDQPALDEDAEPPGPASVFEFQTSTNTGPSQALVKLSTPEERAEARHRCFAELPVEERKKMVKFHDCIDRKFSFPYHLVKTWEGIEELINQAFQHVEVLGPHVVNGFFDLIMRTEAGELTIILPQVWEYTIKPDMAIEIEIWPLRQRPLRPPGYPPGYSSRVVWPPPGSKMYPRSSSNRYPQSRRSTGSKKPSFSRRILRMAAGAGH